MQVDLRHRPPAGPPAVPVDADQAQLRTDLGLAAQAGQAMPAGDRGVHNHRPPGPAPAGGDAHDLVPEGQRQPGPRMRTGRDVQVGAAQTDEHRLDHDLTRLRGYPRRWAEAEFAWPVKDERISPA